MVICVALNCRAGRINFVDEQVLSRGESHIGVDPLDASAIVSGVSAPTTAPSSARRTCGGFTSFARDQRRGERQRNEHW
jgi:hypothetical protein